MARIDINTEITTTARRIQRQLRDFHEGLCVWFSAEGEYITPDDKSLYPAEQQAWQKTYPEAEVQFFGGKRTQREIQDELDAFQAWKRGEVEYTIDYSEELQAARQVAANN